MTPRVASLHIQLRACASVLGAYKTPLYPEALEQWTQATILAEMAEREDYLRKHGRPAPWVRVLT